MRCQRRYRPVCVDVMMIRTCCVTTVEAAEASQHQGSSSMARKDAETASEKLPQGSYQDTGFFQVSPSTFCFPADAHSSYSAPGNFATNKCCGTKTVVKCWVMSVTGVFDGREQCLTTVWCSLGPVVPTAGHCLDSAAVCAVNLRQQSQHVQC